MSIWSKQSVLDTLAREEGWKDWEDLRKGYGMKKEGLHNVRIVRALELARRRAST